ncbi:unnamed protein product [Clonostachys chloroleuca]|uniref:Uncharacterized protein n=1 Tax=Clonostachys chloroleuca TaxID=1926264 RepID=A0AA35MFC7_9HYPO|nr:unnamed protein product [Clonostachys chloroleuca]
MIQAYTVPPRYSRISTVYKADHNAAITAAKSTNGIIITTSTSDREGLIGVGSVIAHRSPNRPDKIVATYSVTIRSRDNQNPYTAELEAIVMGSYASNRDYPTEWAQPGMARINSYLSKIGAAESGMYKYGYTSETINTI